MYARLLAPLKHLHTVKIECPVFLGDVPFHPFSKTIKWTGECGWCMSNIMDDTDFQAAWVAKKQEPGVDPHSPPPRPPALQTVIWNLKWQVQAVYGLLGQASDAHYTLTDEEDYSEVGTDVVRTYTLLYRPPESSHVVMFPHQAPSPFLPPALDWLSDRSLLSGSYGCRFSTFGLIIRVVRAAERLLFWCHPLPFRGRFGFRLGI
jgi:hypothetical protein